MGELQHRSGPRISAGLALPIVSQLRETGSDVGDLLRQLGVSEEEGTSFKPILDELRRELAISYVQERQLSTGEIAFLLRYSEPSAFQRAFKRWTRLTPSEFRAR